MDQNHSNIQSFFETTLEQFVAEIQQDQSIVAALLFGSLVNGFVWEKSDIDLLLITNHEKTPYEFHWVDVNGLNLQVTVYSRYHFKRTVEQELAGSWIQHILQTGKVLFARDPMIEEYVLQAQNLGKRDIELRMLATVAMVIGDLEKAEKILTLTGDVSQSYLFVTRLLDRLAQIEVLLHGDIPGREVIAQALQINPELFLLIFPQVILEPTTPEKLRIVLTAIRAALIQHTPVLFRLVLEYFKNEAEIRSLSDLARHLNRQQKSDWWEVAGLCYGEWLAERGYLKRFSAPLRLTLHSRFTIDEVAYLWIGEGAEHGA